MQLVVMGVSGVGKSTVAEDVASRLGWTFAEGDDFHPAANLAAMAAGRPLTDDDRWPWLRRVGDWLSAEIAAGRSSVVTCSALRRSYRDVLRQDRPEVVFCHLDADPDVVRERMLRRTGHFMRADLLPSQLAALEPLEPDERGVVVDADGEPDVVAGRVLGALDLRRSG